VSAILGEKSGDVAPALPLGLALNVVDKVRNRDLQNLGKAQEHQQSRVANSPLNPADVGPVQSDLIGEVFLTDPKRYAVTMHSPAEGDPRVLSPADLDGCRHRAPWLSRRLRASLGRAWRWRSGSGGGLAHTESKPAPCCQTTVYRPVVYSLQIDADRP
jgi:hypothetical protein